MSLLTRQSGRLRLFGGAAGARTGHAVQTRGFTLVELMVALAVSAVLLMIAVPSFTRMTLSNKLNASANELVGSLNAARMQAIKTNSSVQFCSNSSTVNSGSALGTECGTEAGAVVATADATALKVRAGPTSITGSIQFSGNVQALRYGGDGLARAVGSTTLFGSTVADICTSSLSTDNNRHIVMIGGSVIVTTTTTKTSCP